MSCGLSEAMKGAADQVDALNEKFDAAVMNSPIGELGNIAEKAEAGAQGVMDKLNDAIPSIKLPNLPFDQLPLQDQFKELAALTALGILQAPKIAQQLELMKRKYKGTDIDIDNLAQLLRSGAMDIDKICKLVPNVDMQGVNVEVKGVPTSFPDIDPVALIRKGKLPDSPIIDKDFIHLDTRVVSKKQADDFLTIELPSFDF